MKKLLIINDVGKLINFKNKEIRTPAQIKINDNDLKHLEIVLKMIGIKDYKVINNFDIIEEKNKKEKIIPIEEIIIKDDDDNNPKTILKKLINKEL
jgi:hypothetical protein